MKIAGWKNFTPGRVPSASETAAWIHALANKTGGDEEVIIVEAGDEEKNAKVVGAMQLHIINKKKKEARFGIIIAEGEEDLEFWADAIRGFAGHVANKSRIQRIVCSCGLNKEYFIKLFIAVGAKKNGPGEYYLRIDEDKTPPS